MLMQRLRCCMVFGSRALSLSAVARVAIRDPATMRLVAPMTLNLQEQRGVSDETLSGMIWHCPNAPEHSSLASRITLRLPLSKSKTLRRKYSLFGSDRYLRLGRVLEDLDALAADIAYKHTGPSPIIVTACMDRMRLFSELKISDDLNLEGAVVHVGRSSMQVSMCVSEVGDGGAPVPLATSTFLMVSRTRDRDFAQPVPPLQHDDSVAESIPRTEPKLEPVPPWSEQDIAQILQLHRQKRHDPDRFIWHREARDDKTVVMHCQNRNIYGRMFGGHLMASAYELAWLLAFRLARCCPSPNFIDDIEFIHPVEIGSIVSFQAQVVYTNQGLAVVNVDARVINPVSGESTVTNTFHFGFDVGERIRQVVPDRYDEMVKYIDGMRRCQSFQAT